MHSNIIDFSSAYAFYLAVGAILLTTFYYIIQKRGLPPGPIGIPFVGYWAFLKPDTCHYQLQKLKEKYGDVSSFTVSGHLYINLGTIKAAREAIVTKSDSIIFRISDFNLLRNSFNDSVSFINGEGWQVLRKFFLLKFKERGFNSFKDANCGPIYDAIKGSVEELREANERSIDIVEVLSKSCNKILRVSLFGETGITDEELAGICNDYEVVVVNMTGPNLLLVGDFARYFILPFTKGNRAAMKHNIMMQDKVYKIIDKHKATYDETNIRDIIDLYIKEKNERESRYDPTVKYFTDEALMGSYVQFIGDGIMTVAVFVCAFFRALLDHPEEQEKIYRELIEVVGINRDPSIEDKSRLPYTNAFILEVVRTTDMFPFFPHMEASKDMTLQGYRIPKGSLFLLNMWAAHYDSTEYEEPNRFNPSRFISKDGRKRAEPPILFGMGKRACMGEGFTMSQAFLFLTTIVKHFHLSRAPGGKDQFLFLAGKLEVCAHPRNPG